MIIKLVKVNENNEVKEIIHYDEFKIKFPKTTFPPIENFDPKPYGYKKVFVSQELPLDDTKNIESSLVYDEQNDCYNLNFYYVDKSQEELEIVYEKKWIYVRMVRNQKLYQSDWTQLPDSPLSPEKVDAWKVYRQILRDITNTELSPYEIVFPSEPQ